MKLQFSIRLSSHTKLYTVIISVLLSMVLIEAGPFPLYSGASNLYENSEPYNLSEETYTFSEVWSTPAQDNINFLSNSYNSPIVTRDGITFVLYIDTTERMKIAKIDGATVTEAFIDTKLYTPAEFYLNTDTDSTNDRTEADYYRVKHNDSHHAVSLGIDELGYLHVVGDMHNYPRYMTPQEHLPLKYVNQNILYWRSDTPLDITSFTFTGDQKSKSPQGTGFTYAYFFNDMNGKLFYTARGQQKSSLRCAIFSRYNSSTGDWSIIGDTISGEPDNPRTFYDDGREYDSSNVDNKYSKTNPRGVFDRENSLHMVAPLLDDPTFTPWGMGNGQHFVNTVVYAKSDDVQNFTKADGNPMTLPATVNLTSNKADIIWGDSGYLGVLGNIAVDYLNRPYSVVKKKFFDGSDGESYIIGWNGTAWENFGERVVSAADFRLIHDPAGVMNYIPDSNNRFYRFWNPADSMHVVNLPWSIRVIDDEYLKATGNIMGISKIDGKLVVVKVEIENRPLGVTSIGNSNFKKKISLPSAMHKVSIYTASGRKVYSTTTMYNNIRPLVKSLKLSSGLYLIQGLNVNEKIVVQ